MPARPSRPGKSPRSRRRSFEVLEHRALLAADFGDAPSPYPTLLAENGAQHELTGPTLGTTRDAEADGAHSAGADGDGADDDGVTFGTIQVGALDATLTVNVQGGAAKLDAWVDFNGDGSWAGPGEQIFASQNVAIGDNSLTFDVPSWAVNGTTYARFRLSAAGGLGPAGAAGDGEVEDDAISIQPPAIASGQFGESNSISTDAQWAGSVIGADVDGDGDMDVVSASSDQHEIVWYENDGNAQFTDHPLPLVSLGSESVAAADIDADGDLDILSAASSTDTVHWYENDGAETFTPHLISAEVDGAYSVTSADVDGDGDLDVVAAGFLGGEITWFENDGSQGFTEHVVSSSAPAKSIFVADVDRDGDLDVLSAGGHLVWYENDGNQSFTEHVIFDEAFSMLAVFASDMDADGDLDVLSGARFDNTLSWWENDGNQAFTEHAILGEEDLDVVHSVFAADVDGDGDQDVLSAGIYDGGPSRIAWYQNDGSQNFSRQTITSGRFGGSSAFAADVDGDGDLDVLAAHGSDGVIDWYESNWAPTLSANNGLTVEEGGVATIDPSHLAGADQDGNAAELVYTITSTPWRGYLERIASPGEAIRSFTQAEIDNQQIRYSHYGWETAPDSFTFTLTDDAGVKSGSHTFTISVTPTNDAPYLFVDRENPVLSPTAEDARVPASTLVSSLIKGAVIDDDPNALRGIAVTGASSYHGTWQFSTNGGKAWQAMGEVSESAARLLPGWARVRFVPKTDFHGTVKLFYRAWDQTEGEVGGTFSVQGHTGGATAFSTNYENASLAVTPVNDPAKLGLGGTIAYVRDSAPITLAAGALVSDIDSSNFYQGRLRVRITDGASTSNRLSIGAGFTVDAENNVLQGTTIIGKRVSSGWGTSELVITFKTNVTPAVAQQLVRAITFKTVGGAAGKRTVLFTVSDGDGGVSGEAVKTVEVS